MENVENKIISRIYGHGRGWVFTPKDFIDCGGRSAIDTALNRLVKKGIVRKCLRGIYDYPRYSNLFNAPASPEPDQIARTIARVHSWTIIPSGETALNLLGLSTQVPGKYIYFSDGTSRMYSWDGGVISFKKRAIKETAALSSCTALVVQALKAMGEKNVTLEVISKLKETLSDQDKKVALREAKYVTGWVYEMIKKIADGST
jgi:hypothetical protein